jgi:hypothetical protein
MLPLSHFSIKHFRYSARFSQQFSSSVQSSAKGACAKMFKSIFIVAAAAALIGVEAQASFVFLAVNDTQVINYHEVFNGANLSATVQYTLTALGGQSPNTASFHIVAINSTTAGQPGTNRMTSFGVGVLMPGLTSIDLNSSLNWTATFGPTVPGFDRVGLCVFAGATCGGSSSGGLAEGSDSVAFDIAVHLSQIPAPGGITFESPFVIQFQDAGMNGASVEFEGCAASDATCQGTPPQDIPEPGGLVLVGIAMLGSIAATRRPSCRTGH